MPEVVRGSVREAEVVRALLLSSSAEPIRRVVVLTSGKREETFSAVMVAVVDILT